MIIKYGLDGTDLESIISQHLQDTYDMPENTPITFQVQDQNMEWVTLPRTAIWVKVKYEKGLP